MTNPLADWLARYQRPGAPEGPTRGECLREPLEPGDVWEDGAIQVTLFTRTRAGPAWIAERQLAAAEYYGWSVAHDQYGPIGTELDGKLVYLVARCI